MEDEIFIMCKKQYFIILNLRQRAWHICWVLRRENSDEKKYSFSSWIAHHYSNIEINTLLLFVVVVVYYVGVGIRQNIRGAFHTHHMHLIYLAELHVLYFYFVLFFSRSCYYYYLLHCKPVVARLTIIWWRKSFIFQMKNINGKYTLWIHCPISIWICIFNGYQTYNG